MKHMLTLILLTACSSTVRYEKEVEDAQVSEQKADAQTEPSACDSECHGCPDCMSSCLCVTGQVTECELACNP